MTSTMRTHQTLLTPDALDRIAEHLDLTEPIATDQTVILAATKAGLTQGSRETDGAVIARLVATEHELAWQRIRTATLQGQTRRQGQRALALLDTIATIRGIHRQDTAPTGRCTSCGTAHPCATMRAINALAPEHLAPVGREPDGN